MTVHNVFHGNGDHFEILLTTQHSQIARFILAPGEASNNKPNKHPNSDQILIVLEGEVVAEIDDETRTLHKGDVVVVPADTPHLFRNNTDQRAVTFTSYAPAAYPSAT